MNSSQPPEDKTRNDKAAPPDGLDLEIWARDWITLWQSEFTAMAADRELREGWTQLMALWAGAATEAAEAGMRLYHLHDRAPRSAASDAAARPAAGAAAPDAGDDAVERLHQRIAALEARLRALEQGGG